MKFCRRTAILLASVVLATVVLLSGCATSSVGKAPNMVATLQSVKDDFNLMKLRTEATEDALIELSVSPDTDLKLAFGAFSNSVDQLQDAGKTMILHADAMHFEGQSYLVESEKSVTACVYPRLRVPGDRRPAELGEYFDAISEKSWEVKRAYRAYQFDVKQIQTELSYRLAPVNIGIISFMFDKAKVDSDSLLESLENALEAMEQAKTAKAQAVPQGG
jgi:hypothetical protein